MKQIIEKMGNPKKIYPIIFLLVIIIFFSSYLYDIYSVFRYGSDTYYVNLFPEDSESKNYRVIGEVDYESEYDEYYLIKATFPNGGYITFDDYYTISPLEFNEKVYMEDDEGKGWYVELTKEKVKGE